MNYCLSRGRIRSRTKYPCHVLPDHHGQLYVILSLVVHLVIFKLFTEFLGILKKEDPNNEENVLSEIKIDEKEEPVGKNVPSDNLEHGACGRCPRGLMCPKGYLNGFA